MTRKATISGLVAVALAAIAVPLAVMASSSGGPLANPTAGGQPNFPVDGGFANPGQSADFNVYVINTARDPVTLVSASLIAISGHPTGRLVFVAVPVQRGDGIAGGRGFPVHGMPTRPFRGARLPHGFNSVIFGFAGSRIGGYYMVAGLRITYRYHGQLYTVQAWSASTNCVVRNWRTAGNDPGCNRAGSVDQHATEHLAGV